MSPEIQATKHCVSEHSILLNVGFTRLAPEQAENTILDCVESGAGGYACFSNVHTTVLANQNFSYRFALNRSTLTFADGKPIYWYSKLKNKETVYHTPGPDFMCHMLKKKYRQPIKHYFLGSTDEVLSNLVAQTELMYPDAEIVGTFSPPFRDLSEAEIESMLGNIRKAKPHLVWVGLGAPKQECWMMDYVERLKPAFLLGVGAAFDFNAGMKKRAPLSVRKLGFEWLYRLLQEPGRLSGRYFKTNIIFLYLVIKSFVNPGSIK